MMLQFRSLVDRTLKHFLVVMTLKFVVRGKKNYVEICNNIFLFFLIPKYYTWKMSDYVKYI